MRMSGLNPYYLILWSMLRRSNFWTWISWLGEWKSWFTLMKRRRRSIEVFNHRCVKETLRGQPNLFPLPSYLVLFFVADSSVDTVKEDSEYVGLRCIICNASIQMEVKQGGKLTRNTHVLKSHLDLFTTVSLRPCHLSIQQWLIFWKNTTGVVLRVRATF